VQDLLKELQSNTRLRIGIWLIMAIMIIYGLMLINDNLKLKQVEFQSTVKHFNQIKNVSEQKSWLKRRKKIKKILIELQDKLWGIDSKGLAQASLQNWIDEKIKMSEIEKPRVKVEPAISVSKYENVWSCTAKLNGVFTSKSLEEFVYYISKSKTLMIVERLEMRKSKRPSFTLVFTAYFQSIKS
jgi:hypothetical protein